MSAVHKLRVARSSSRRSGWCGAGQGEGQWRLRGDTRRLRLMSWHALTRSVLLAASLLTGLGPSANALAHGFAHAHEAEHRLLVQAPDTFVGEHRGDTAQDTWHHASHHTSHHTSHATSHHASHATSPQATTPESPRLAERLVTEFTAPDHEHGHVHAIIDAGLKTRGDLLPVPVPTQQTPLLAEVGAVDQAAPYSTGPAPPPERRHTAGSPRAPPAR